MNQIKSNRIIQNHQKMSTATDYGSVATTGENHDISSAEFHWTAFTILQSIVLFLLAGVAEIVGGWMVWYVIENDTVL